MAREVVYRWACELCGKQYGSEALADECESSHQTEGEIVETEGYRRQHGTEPRDVTIQWANGTRVLYRRVPGQE